MHAISFVTFSSHFSRIKLLNLMNIINKFDKNFEFLMNMEGHIWNNLKFVVQETKYIKKGSQF